MDNTVFRLYIPVRRNGDIYEYVLDSSGKIKVYTSLEALRKYNKHYDYVYCYDLTLSL